MELKPNTAKVTSLGTNFDPAPVDTALGPVVWTTVRIEYTLAGLTPSVDIRVPIVFETADSEAARSARALRSARLLIDHACRAAGIASEDAPSYPLKTVIEEITPAAMEGLAQELGISDPTTRPKRTRPSKA